MQDVKKKKKRQTTSASEVIADLFIVSDTHLSLPLSLMQYETVPELHAKKISYILTKPDTRWSQRIASNTKLFIVAQKLHNWLQLKGDSEMLFILAGSVIYFKQLQY